MFAARASRQVAGARATELWLTEKGACPRRRPFVNEDLVNLVPGDRSFVTNIGSGALPGRSKKKRRCPDLQPPVPLLPPQLQVDPSRR